MTRAERTMRAGEATRAGAEHGFTLVELLVTMALALVVFGATLTVIEVFQRDDVYAQQRNENQDNARNAMDRISTALRNVIAPKETYAGSLEQGDEYSLMFQTVDTSGLTSSENPTRAMRVRYCLDNSTPSNEVLWEQVRRWGRTESPSPGAEALKSCPDRTKEGTSEADWNETRQLVQHVTNEAGGQDERRLFRYSTSEAPQTLTVETNLFLELNPGHSPGETELTSGVSLRNANRKPVATFTANFPALEQKEVELNASESYDPGGLALTYKWWENGTLLSSNAQIFAVKELKEKTEYKFKLEVTNPGGLSAEVERAVKTK
jgi:prepilin-type N-terminal cleavage/methylation domain-containing protein